MNSHTTLDLHAMAEEDWPIEMSIRGNFHFATDPDIPIDPLSYPRDIDFPREVIGRRTHIFLNGADICPIAVCNIPEEGLILGEHSRENILGPVDHGSFLDEVEDGRLQHVDTGVHHVREELAPGGFFKKLCNLPIRIGDDHAIV